MKRFLFTLLTICAAMRGGAQQATWLTSFPDAAEQASREHKLILMDFTGSDWCGWCMKLDAETFSKPAFAAFAADNLVLVKVDFPRNKSLPGDLQDANRALKNKYDVSGYPTVVIVKPDGKILWDQRGYVAGGPAVILRAAIQCFKAAGLTPTQPQIQPQAPVAAAPVQPVPAPTPVRYAQPAPPPPPPGGGPRLQGILYSTSHASAVIDGKICEEGDFVSNVRVLKIARDSVTIESQGQSKVLRMTDSQGEMKVVKTN